MQPGMTRARLLACSDMDSMVGALLLVLCSLCKNMQLLNTL